MKKIYVKPRTIEVQVNAESVMMTYSTGITGGREPKTEMGDDGEGQYGRCLNDYTDFT